MSTQGLQVKAWAMPWPPYGCPILLPPALYDRAEAMGIDMRYYDRIKPIPMSALDETKVR